MASMPSSQMEVSTLLDNHTTDKYFIEYRGFMSNHLSHGLYALQQLEAPLERINKFIDFHVTNKLESAETHRQQETSESPEPEDVTALLGARKSFYYLRDYYDKLLKETYDNNVDDLIKNEFPKLSRGMVCSAFHGLIHLGYGYHAHKPWFVVEGMAYLHHSYLPLTVDVSAATNHDFGGGSTNLVDVIDMVVNDEPLGNFMEEEFDKPFWKTKTGGGFQPRVGCLVYRRASILLKYVNSIEFPKELNPKNVTKKDIPKLANWLCDCAIIAYAIGSLPNDFLLLHGVTSSWALKNIFHLLDLEQALDAVQTFLCLLLAVVRVRGLPFHNSLVTNNPGMSYSWDDIIRRAVTHEQYGEEHTYKLVQVCKSRSDENTDPGMEAIYRLAAYHCVTEELVIQIVKPAEQPVGVS